MREINKIPIFYRFVLAFITIYWMPQATAQLTNLPIDYTITCNGIVENQSNRAIQLFVNYRLGGLSIDGTLNGEAFTGAEFSTNPQYWELVGFPKSQDTGNVRDINRKMTVSIQKDSGVFRLKIEGIHGQSFFLSGGGVCQRS